MIHDEKYWNEFYIQNSELSDPSSFAMYVYEKYINNGLVDSKLIELGCGNGRDSLFFASKKVSVEAIDYSKETISKLKKLDANSINFENKNFAEINEYKDFNFVYSRFTFHSIDDETEKNTLDLLYNVLSDNGLFMLEARTTKDESLNKVFGINHYRRYLDFTKTCEKIELLGFKIIEKIESQDLSPYKGENPYLLRIIAEKVS